MTTVLEFPLPGVAPERLSVEQTGRVLSVRAERPAAPGVRYLRQQIPAGRFEAHYRLPPHVEVERAAFEHGILSIQLTERLPEALRPRAIPIATTRTRATPRLGRPAPSGPGWLDRAVAWVRRQLPDRVPARA